jgi:ribosomal protein S18 acetylase RimI-like enzyme
VPAPRLPGGYALRPLASRGDLAAYVAAWRDALGPPAPAEEELRAARGEADGLPALLAVAPDGAVHAWCDCRVFALENALLGRRDGWIDQLGVRPAVRRRGLGRAALWAGLRLLAARGAGQAVLHTRRGVAPARALYDSEGFRLVHAVHTFARRV